MTVQQDKSKVVRKLRCAVYPRKSSEECAFHGSWAPIPRDRGHSFHGIVGSHSTRMWAADLTDGFMESGLC